MILGKAVRQTAQQISENRHERSSVSKSEQKGGLVNGFCSLSGNFPGRCAEPCSPPSSASLGCPAARRNPEVVIPDMTHLIQFNSAGPEGFVSLRDKQYKHRHTHRRSKPASAGARHFHASETSEPLLNSRCATARSPVCAASTSPVNIEPTSTTAISRPSGDGTRPAFHAR